MRATRRSPFRMLIVGAVIALLAIPVVVAGAADDQPEIGFASGITPVSPDPDPVDVYVANADGTGMTNLTAGYGAEWSWAWSPDGSRIAFVSHDDGVQKLYVRTVGGAEPLAVAEGIERDEGWAWSPNSIQIAYVSLKDGDTDIYLADVAAGTSRNVSNDALGSSRPRWSPTGTHVAYDVQWEDSNGRHADVYITPATGGDAVNVTKDGSSRGGSWSPDGSQFVFVTSRSGDDEIYVSDGDGRNPVRLTNNPANDRDPAWSPNGTQIAFSSGLGTGGDGCNTWEVVTPSRIYVMEADGSNRRAITDGSIDKSSGDVDYEISQAGPTWSPDGSRVAVASTLDGCGPHQRLFTIYAADPTGSGSPVEIWSGGGGWWLRWSPDGARLSIRSTGNYGIDSTTVIAAADGSGTPLELVRGVGSGPEGWSTYGNRFAFANSGGAGPGDTVFVTAPDGTNSVDITGGLAGPVNSYAAWRPQPLGPVGLVDPSTGLWYLRDEWGVIDSFYYGNPGDVPFMGDWDGDGVETPGLYRQSDGYVYLRNSNTQGIADIRFFFGNPGDVPLAGDFDGDGFDTVSIYRPSEQRFYIINELGENDGGLGAAEYSFVFGNPGDQPVVGDWDGDGVDEIGLHRASTGFFYYRNTLTTGIADAEFYFGNPGDRFVAGDWGVIDGRDTPAVFRPSNTVFYFRHTLTQGNADSQFTWPAGESDWIPVAGAYTN